MSRIAHHRPQYPDHFGQFKMSYHLEMISDRERTAAIFHALDSCLDPEMVFCELGCGTAIFSIFAAGRCKKVYAVELDPAVAAVARANIERSRFADRIELLVTDALTVELPEPVDATFCEMMSIWTVEEPQVLVANRARHDLLKPRGLFLPSRIINLAELGHYNFGSGEVVMKATTPLFTGIVKPAVMTESALGGSWISPALSIGASAWTLSSRFSPPGSSTVHCSARSFSSDLGSSSPVPIR